MTAAELRTCTLCKVAKPVTEFHKKTRYHDGLDPWCKACKHKKDYARYHADPKAAYKRVREYIMANPEKHAEYQRKSAVKLREQERTKRRNEINELTDSYVRQLFCENNGLSHADIPQCLVDARRELIKLKRALKCKTVTN